MDNQEARGRQPASSSSLNQEQWFFGQGCGQLAVKDRLVNSPRLSMPGESWKPLGLFQFCWAQGRLLAAPSLTTNSWTFEGNPTRGLCRTEKRSGLCLSLFLLYPKLFIAGTRNQVGIRKFSTCHFYGPWKTKNKIEQKISRQEAQKMVTYRGNKEF